MDIYAAFMQSPVAIVILKGNGYIIHFANDFYLQILGQDKTIIGKPLFDVFPELESRGLKDFLDTVIKSDKAAHVNEYELYILKDGKKELCFFNGDYQPLIGKDGDKGIIMILTQVTDAVLEKKIQTAEQQKLTEELDHTKLQLLLQGDEKAKRAAELGIANIELLFQHGEKKKRAAELVIANKELAFQNAEKEEHAAELRIANYARSLIEASLDPLFTISPAGKITDMNNASLDITGVSREHLTGSNFFDYFTEPSKAREAYEEVFDKGFVANYPLTIRDHTLTDVLFNGSVYKDQDGKVLGVVIVARDITVQKRFEEELTTAKVAAEAATAQAKDAQSHAESATKTAENAVKAKQQFLSNMSHEIRTPMNAIIGFTKVVLKTDLSEKQREYLNAIKLSGDALIVLINDILDLAKVDSGKMTFEQIPFRLSASISAMLHLFEAKIQEKNLSLVKEYDPHIPEVLIGDPVRLHQVIMNLVGNAVKFTTTGSITVSVRLLGEDSDSTTIEFTVKDTGIGIREDKLEKIFENFQQASSGTSRLYGGTGLGLAIVKQLVEPQGGTISVISKIGEGATFTFVLPFKKTTQQTDSIFEAAEPDSELKNAKVLVVEDMALNQLLMKTLLDDFGFTCEIAANGKIAIDELQAGNYDIILMDLQMPEMNGFETTDYIRNILKSDIPIIALTADVTTADVDKCRAVGMNDYIAKPVNERLLYTKIAELLKRKTAGIQTNNSAGEQAKPTRCIDLDYLIQRTKSNPALLKEMIVLYLEQTPPLIETMKQSFHDKNWQQLHAAVHKMIPSFSIMGISPDFENMARIVKEYAHTHQYAAGIPGMVLQLEHICVQACKELKEELMSIKN